MKALIAFVTITVLLVYFGKSHMILPFFMIAIPMTATVNALSGENTDFSSSEDGNTDFSSSVESSPQAAPVAESAALGFPALQQTTTAPASGGGLLWSATPTFIKNWFRPRSVPKLDEPYTLINTMANRYFAGKQEYQNVWTPELISAIISIVESEAYKNLKSSRSKNVSDAFEKEFYDKVNRVIGTCVPVQKNQRTARAGVHGETMLCEGGICAKQVKQSANVQKSELILEAFIQMLVHTLYPQATLPAVVCQYVGGAYEMRTGKLKMTMAQFMNIPTNIQAQNKSIINREICWGIATALTHLYHINNNKYGFVFSHRDMNTGNIMCEDKHGTPRSQRVEMNGVAVVFKSRLNWKLIDFGLSCIRDNKKGITFTSGNDNFFGTTDVDCSQRQDVAIFLYDLLIHSTNYPFLTELLQFFPSSAINTIRTDIRTKRNISYWPFYNNHYIDPMNVFLWAKRKLR